MKKTLSILLKKYLKMTGDKKIRLGLSLSKTVREVRKSGMTATGV